MDNNDKNTKIDVTSTAVEKGLEIVGDFLKAIVIAPSQELGGILEDRVKLWRFKNQINILQKAEEHIAKNGITTKKIALKTLVPLLEEASLEEEETLKQKWINLLVNYVDSSQNLKNSVFPFILSQLSSNEVIALDNILKEKHKQSTYSLTDKFGLDEAEIQNLIRLGIVESIVKYKTAKSRMNYGDNNQLDVKMDGSLHYIVTKFGTTFIMACQLN
jgi:hypothetical protein